MKCSFLLPLATAVLLALPGTAAEKKPVTRPGPVNPPKKPPPSATPALPQPVPSPIPELEKLWLFHVGVAGVADSNINHTKVAESDTGVVPLAGVGYRRRSDLSRIEIDYEIASHHYFETTVWNRTSHDLRAAYQIRSFERWRPETIGEVTIKGTTEDRDLTDRYSVTQNFDRRMRNGNRLRLFGMARWKDYPSDDQDAFVPALGLEFQHELSPGHEWNLSYRYEQNKAHGFKHRYIRWTYGLDYDVPLSRVSKLDFELKYRPRQYERLVEVGDTEVIRKDRQWYGGVEWVRDLPGKFQLLVAYNGEIRTSNDPDKEFNSNLVSLMLQRLW